MVIDKREIKKVEYVEVYISSDGKEFNDKAECEKWEKSATATAYATWNNIKKFEVDTCDKLSLPWCTCERKSWAVKFDNYDEITAFNYLVDLCKDYGGYRLCGQDVGKTFIVVLGYPCTTFEEADFIEVWDFEDCVKTYNDSANDIREKMKEV